MRAFFPAFNLLIPQVAMTPMRDRERSARDTYL